MVIFSLLFFISGIFSTFTEESGYLKKHENEEEHKNIIDHLFYLASDNAKPKERADLIKSGYAKSAEHFQFPVNSKLSSSSVEFDCKIRKLAFSFAKKFATTGLKDIFDGLQLFSLCNVTFDPTVIRNMKNLDNANAQNDQNSFEIFVDQANGKFGHDGSFGKPLIDIQSGINLCSKNRGNSDILCKVFIRSGVYHIKEPITIKVDNIRLLSYQNEDVSITSDVIVEPRWKLYKTSMETFNGFNPIFEGIKPNQTTKSVIFVGILNNARLCEQTCASQRKCTAFVFFDNSTAQYANHCYMRVDGRWNTLLTSGVISGKKVLIYYADISSYYLKKVDSVFINNRRAIRARYPNANPETMGLHTNPTGYVNNAKKWLPPHKSSAADEVHINSPNRSATLFPAFSIGIGGPVYQFDPPQSYWGIKDPFGGGGSTYKVPSGLQHSKDLEINFRSWKNPSTGIVHAYQHYHLG